MLYVLFFKVNNQTTSYYLTTYFYEVLIFTSFISIIDVEIGNLKFKVF